MNPDRSAIDAMARLHHVYLLGLLLMISYRKGEEAVGEWMFRLFRRQHHDKFLSSFQKLGLDGLPDAVACAKYHVLANGIGGVPVEFMRESDRKAWVRFRYPRWWLDGPTLCGVPPSAGSGFMRGWYAHNGVSLGNPRLGFVCVSEDMTGEFGFCGYFREYDHDLTEDERLQYAKDERPPRFNPGDQPQPPPDQWTEERLAKANRNYAVEFVRNAVCELIGVIGEESTRELGGQAARLIGLQYFPEMAKAVGVEDGNAGDGANLLKQLFAGMGDTCQIQLLDNGERAVVESHSLRIVRGLEDVEHDVLLACWIELWRGMLRSFRQMKRLNTSEGSAGLLWAIEDE